MAKASIVRGQQVVIPPDMVALTLTVEEAGFILSVCNKVSGPSIGSYRGLAENIIEALQDVVHPLSRFDENYIKGSLTCRGLHSDNNSPYKGWK